MPTDSDKQEKLIRAGQSFSARLMSTHKFRGSTLRPDQRFRAPAAQKFGEPDNRESIMPDFNISICDHLGLQSQGVSNFLNQKQSKKLREVLTVNKEPLEDLPYLFTDYVDKYDAKMNKIKVICLMTTKTLYLLNQIDNKFVGEYELKNLTYILMIASKNSLFALKMKKQNPKDKDQTTSNDVFIESSRRPEFIMFLLTNAEK